MLACFVLVGCERVAAALMPVDQIGVDEQSRPYHPASWTSAPECGAACGLNTTEQGLSIASQIAAKVPT